MSRIQTASALLLLSLPNGFASPLAQEAVPILQLLNDASSATATPSGPALAVVKPSASSDVPKPTGVSSLTGGVLNSPEIAKSSASAALVDPSNITGPPDPLIDPIPNPLIPSPNSVADDGASIVVSSVPTFDATTPSPIEVVSAILSLAGTPLALPSNGSLLANFSGLAPSITPVPLPFPLDVSFPDTSLPEETATPMPLPSPLDVSFPDEPLPEETAIPSQPTETAPGSHTLELSEFATIMQQIANVFSSFFQILPPKGAPAADGLTAPFPVLNATLNSTVLERRELNTLATTTSALPPQVVVDLVRKFVALAFELITAAEAAPVVGDKIPNLSGAVGGAASKLPLSDPVPAAANVLGKLPVSVPKSPIPGQPISRIRRQALQDLSAATTAAPVDKITTLLAPMVNMASGLLNQVKEVPGVGGAVANVPLPDALGVVGKGDVSAIDPATAIGMVQTLMDLAAQLVNDLATSETTVSADLQAGTGISKRDTDDMDPALAMDIVGQVVDILNTIVAESPADSATQTVPHDQLLSVANTLGKRSVDVDPAVAFAILKQIIGTMSNLVGIITGLKQTSAGVAAATNGPLDTLAGASAGLPVNDTISKLPVGVVTDNVPAGNIVSKLPVGDLDTNSVTGLLPNVPVDNVASNLPASSIPSALGNLGGLGKRDMSASQSDAVMHIAQEFLSMAMTMSNELTADNAIASTMEKRTVTGANISGDIIAQILNTILTIVSELSKKIRPGIPSPIPYVPSPRPSFTPVPLPLPLSVSFPSAPAAPNVTPVPLPSPLDVSFPSAAPSVPPVPLPSPLDVSFPPAAPSVPPVPLPSPLDVSFPPAAPSVPPVPLPSPLDVSFPPAAPSVRPVPLPSPLDVSFPSAPVVPKLPVSLPSPPVAVPTLPVAVPKLPISLPKLPVQLPTGLLTGLSGTPSSVVARPKLPISIPKLPAFPPADLATGVPSAPVGFPTPLEQLPTTNVPGKPADLADLPTLEIDPLTGLPIEDVPLNHKLKRALAQPNLDPKVAASLLSILLEIATNLVASVHGSGAVTPNLGGFAGGLGSLGGLGKRDDMTAEQDELLSIAQAKQIELQDFLDLTKRQNVPSVLPTDVVSKVTSAVPSAAASGLASAVPLAGAAGSSGGLAPGAVADLTGAVPLGAALGSVGGLPPVLASDPTSSLPVGTDPDLSSIVSGLSDAFSTVIELLSTILGLLNTTPAGAVTNSIPLGNIPGAFGSLGGLGKRDVDGVALTNLLSKVIIILDSLLEMTKLPALQGLLDHLAVNPATLAQGGFPINPALGVGGIWPSALGGVVGKLPTDPLSALGGPVVPKPPVVPASILSSPLADTSGVKATLSLIKDLPLNTFPGALSNPDTRVHARQLLGLSPLLKPVTGATSSLPVLGGLTGQLGGLAGAVSSVAGSVSPQATGNVASAVGSVGGVASPANGVAGSLTGQGSLLAPISGAAGSAGAVLAPVQGVAGSVAPLNAVTGLAGTVAGGKPLGVVGSVAGVAPIVDPVSGVASTVTNGILPGAVGSVAGVLPVDAASPALGVVKPVGDIAAPVLSAAAPVVSAVKPAIGVVSPAVAAISPLASAARPVIAPVEPLLVGPSPIFATPPAIVPLPTSVATSASSAAAALPVVSGVLAPVASAVTPVAGAATPVTGVVSNVTNSLPPLKAILAKLADIKGSLAAAVSALMALKSSAPIAGFPVPIHKRDSSMASQAHVENFIQKWNNIGATMAAANPQAVNDMMEVFMDPSSSPPDMAAMDESSDGLKDFVKEYYELAQAMDASNASADEKLDVLKAMFNENANLQNSKRSMRHGVRESIE